MFFVILLNMIKTFYFNDLRVCCYIIWDDTKECIIVDPGAYSDSEKNRLVKFITENALKPVRLINTHGHFDHVMGNPFILSKWNIPVYMNHGDLKELSRVKSYCAYFGYEIEQPSSDVIDLKDGDVITFGNSSLKVYHTPGHSQGSVILYNEADKYVLTGDILFAGSIGRTDLPGGDYDVIKESLSTKVLTLPPDTVVYPGHGPVTEIAQEINTNPFLEFFHGQEPDFIA